MVIPLAGISSILGGAGKYVLGAGKYLVDYFKGAAKDGAKEVASKAFKSGGEDVPHPAVLAGPKHLVTGNALEGKRTVSPTSYKDTADYGVHPRAYRPVYATALLIPLILGAAWMAYLVVGSKAKPVEAQLSPATNSLVASLFIFIIVYSAFLAFFFWNRTRALKAKETKKIIKKSKRKR